VINCLILIIIVRTVMSMNSQKKVFNITLKSSFLMFHLLSIGSMKIYILMI